jgi:hypothetical protein
LSYFVIYLGIYIMSRTSLQSESRDQRIIFHHNFRKRNIQTIENR